MSVTTEERPPGEDPVPAGTSPSSPPRDDPAPASRWQRLRPGRLSIVGGVLGLAFALMSVTPSFVPRGWTMQALLVALCTLSGYAIGAFLGWAYRTLRLPPLPDGARRVAWLVIAVVAVLGLPVAAWFGRVWQVDQREMFGGWIAWGVLGASAVLAVAAIARRLKEQYEW